MGRKLRSERDEVHNSEDYDSKLWATYEILFKLCEKAWGLDESGGLRHGDELHEISRNQGWTSAEISVKIAVGVK